MRTKQVSDYFRSITLEFQALKYRVRHLIRDQHWLTDGEWKESVLRAVLDDICLQNIGVGKGFVIYEGRSFFPNRYSFV